MKFEIIKSKTQDHWLELQGTDVGFVFENEDKKGKTIWNYKVVCKWDGCVDFRQYSNGYSWDHECNDECQCLEEYIHICDVDDFMKVLEEIKKQGKEFFKDKSGSEYWV